MLNDIVSPIQSAFVSNRLIQDNIIIVQEIYHSLEKRKSNGAENMVIKLDMNKSYDRMEWNFIESVLKAFGFHPKWVKLIMECITTTSYRIKVNGALSRKIIPSRGLRQGYPLSPYLFILAAEVLTALMKEAQEQGRIKGFKIAPTAPTLTHLLFADDCIILAEATVKE
ncbi:secreted RxLR effector protein 78-like [Arachis hypogaea]|uniref:secreted RxLR effector protein 78-like n=1 Tax=Arachis hypogaea TaxID=3818 RepID=UPI003B20FC10